MTPQRGSSRLWSLLAVLVMAAALCAVPSSASAAPGPPGYPQWYFDDWDIPGIWAGGARGQGITIAEIDTGVNADVVELAGKVLPGRDFGDPTENGQKDQDLEEFGHGTAMASLMVAEPGLGGTRGIAPDARVLPGAIPLIGTATEGTTGDSLPLAITWAADQGAEIISLSLGQQRLEGTDRLACPEDEQASILYAISKGAIVVAASGNEGEEGSPASDPGVCIGVVAVGAVDSADEVASFSSRHPYLTLTAPGEEVPSLSRIPGRVYIGSGTSQATAITSAGLALVWSKYPDLTNDQVVARVLATLDRRVASPDPAYGYGILDIGAAISTDVPTDAVNPIALAAAPFLALTEALAAQPTEGETSAPAVEIADAVPGALVVGSRASDLTTPVVQGAALAGAGLLLLLVLIGIGVRGWRRRRRAAAVG